MTYRPLGTGSLVAAISVMVSLQGIAAEDLRLLEAVKRQDQQATRRLLQQHIDPDARQGDGATALHWAVHWEDIDTVELLIQAGANVSVANDLGVTPLVMACTSGNARIADRLLAAGADPSVSLPGGESPLMLASRTGTLETVKKLLARGANPNQAEGTRGQTALMWAIANRHPGVVKELLDHGADIRARTRVRRTVFNMGGNRSAGSASLDTPLAEVDLGGSTPLLFAARSGDHQSARLLVGSGANVNDTAADGNAVLIVAAHSGHGSLAAFLVEAGADANAAPLGYSALHAAVLRGHLRDRDVRNADPGAGVSLVKTLLAHGADPNPQTSKGTRLRRWSHDFALIERWVGATPFWLAARFLELEMMRALIAAGANPTLASRDGTTPLMAAAGLGYSRASGTAAFIKDRRDFSYYNADPTENATKVPDEEERLSREAVAFLLEQGVNLNAANQAGDTALHGASALGMNSVIQLLVDRGADVNVRNKAGRTPLAVARRSSGVGDSVVNQKTAELLQRLGAR